MYLILVFFEKFYYKLAYIFIGLAVGFIWIIPITITITYHTYRKNHPYLGPPFDEIKGIKDFLETKEVKEFILYICSRKKSSVYMICRRIERIFGVKLRYKKGPQWGQVIAEIDEKIYEIVGVKNEEEYRIRIHTQ